MRLASRMERIGTETAFEAAARARALEATGRDVIHLEMGEPDFDTPRNVSERAARALLDEGATHYTAATGILPLREAIAADVKRWKGITASPDQVVVTPGAKPIMFYAMLALIEEGDEVIYPNPGFPIYESMARYVGGTAVAAPLREANDFRMDVDEVASLITPRTKLLITNSPHNPTGSILTDADTRRLAELAVEHDLVVLADEIYSAAPVLGRAALDRHPAGHGRAHDHPRRVQQDLRDDRLAARLRRSSPSGWRRHSAAWSSTASRARTPSPSSARSRR